MLDSLDEHVTYETVQIGAYTTVPMDMEVQVDTAFKTGTAIHIYRFNPTTYKNEYIGESIAGKKGSVTFTTNLLGNYIFTDSVL